MNDIEEILTWKRRAESAESKAVQLRVALDAALAAIDAAEDIFLFEGVGNISGLLKTFRTKAAEVRVIDGEYKP